MTSSHVLVGFLWPPWGPLDGSRPQRGGCGSASVVVVEVIGVRGEKGGVSDCRVFSLHRVLSLCEGAWGGHPSRYRSPAFRGSVWAGGINVEWLVISW